MKIKTNIIKLIIGLLLINIFSGCLSSAPSYTDYPVSNVQFILNTSDRHVIVNYTNNGSAEVITLHRPLTGYVSNENILRKFSDGHYELYWHETPARIHKIPAYTPTPIKTPNNDISIVYLPSSISPTGDNMWIPI